jgi:hypothetical protein
MFMKWTHVQDWSCPYISLSVRLFVRMFQLEIAGRIFMKIDSAEVHEILSSHFNFNLNQICLMTTLHKNLQALLHVS